MRINPDKTFAKCDRCKILTDVIRFGKITKKKSQIRYYCKSCLKRPKLKCYS